MSRTFRLVALAAVSVILAGCPEPPRPNPSDTAFGPGSQSADWIDPTLIYGSGAEGLNMRDADFAGEGQRVENLFPNIYFETDTAFVSAGERPKLAEVAEHLKQYPQDKLLVEGFCDWRGTREYNLALGDRRAISVKQYLQDLGIDPNRLNTLSHGDLEADENVPADRMKEDRRASLVIIR
ncbi:MAG: OmpA family protein [Opitutales bacterium]|nr:OmpA family protein [Opitutales bacterium]